MDQTTTIISLTIVCPQGCSSVCQCPLCATIPTRTSRGSTFPPSCGMRTWTILGGSTMPRTPSANCWMSRRSWCHGRIGSTMMGGARQRKPAIIIDGKRYRIVELRRRGLPRSWTWRGGRVQSHLPTQRHPLRRLRLTGAEMCK
jgi:hypothetical protein